MTQLVLSYLAAGFKGAGFWSWNYRPTGFEAGEYALLDRTLKPTARAIQTGKLAQAANKYRDELWLVHKEPSVGVLINWDSDAIWAAMAVRQRDHFKHYPMQARVGISRALSNANVPWEYVTVDDLKAGLAPRYKAIYLPAQLAISNDGLKLLLAYAQQGGRVVLDAPGAAYDEHGKVLDTRKGSVFEQLFGVEATGLPAATRNKTGRGEGMILAWDASFELFLPGNEVAEQQLISQLAEGIERRYSCNGAIAYRIAAPEADHYFLLNDGPTKQVRLNTPGHRYSAIEDPVEGKALTLGEPITLEAYSGRWLRLKRSGMGQTAP